MRDALEQAGTIVQSTTQINDLQVTLDRILASSAGIVKVRNPTYRSRADGDTAVWSVDADCVLDVDDLAKRMTTIEHGAHDANAPPADRTGEQHRAQGAPPEMKALGDLFGFPLGADQQSVLSTLKSHAMMSAGQWPRVGYVSRHGAEDLVGVVDILRTPRFPLALPGTDPNNVPYVIRLLGFENGRLVAIYIAFEEQLGDTYNCVEREPIAQLALKWVQNAMGDTREAIREVTPTGIEVITKFAGVQTSPSIMSLLNT